MKFDGELSVNGISLSCGQVSFGARHCAANVPITLTDAGSITIESLQQTAELVAFFEDRTLGRIECGWSVYQMLVDHFKPAPRKQSALGLNHVPIQAKDGLGYKAILYAVTGKVMQEIDFTPSELK